MEPTLETIADSIWRRSMHRWQDARAIARRQATDDDHPAMRRADQLETEYLASCESTDAALAAVSAELMEG